MCFRNNGCFRKCFRKIVRHSGLFAWVLSESWRHLRALLLGVLAGSFREYLFGLRRRQLEPQRQSYVLRGSLRFVFQLWSHSWEKGCNSLRSQELIYGKPPISTSIPRIPHFLCDSNCLNFIACLPAQQKLFFKVFFLFLIETSGLFRHFDGSALRLYFSRKDWKRRTFEDFLLITTMKKLVPVAYFRPVK